jgi:uncharacterized protein YciI
MPDPAAPLGLVHALRYEYPPDVLERRAPHREGHLAMLRAEREAGRVVMGGALGDPPTEALIVFRDASDAEDFVARDPYVAGGVVASWRVEPWNVVV